MWFWHGLIIFISECSNHKFDRLLASQTCDCFPCPWIQGAQRAQLFSLSTVMCALSWIMLHPEYYRPHIILCLSLFHPCLSHLITCVSFQSWYIRNGFQFYRMENGDWRHGISSSMFVILFVHHLSSYLGLENCHILSRKNLLMMSW